MLDAIGLSALEERAYRELVRSPPMTATELAALLDCSPTHARRALTSLERAGLAERAGRCGGADEDGADEPGGPEGGGGRAGRWVAVDPSVGLSALVRSRRTDLDRVLGAVGAFAAEFHERTLRSAPGRLVEVVEGPRAIAARVTELMASAEREVLAFDAPPYVTPDERAFADERALLGRGVTVRAVYAHEVLAVPERARLIAELAGLGERARVAPRVPLKMVIVDGRDAVVPLTPASASARSALAAVHRSQLCDALIALFEEVWQKAAPVMGEPERGVRPADGGPGPEDRALLRLLNAGLKDEAVARQLGVSERTLRRRITALTLRLGATSRFQAGAQAVRRGWI